MYKLNVSIDEKDELKRLYGIWWNPDERYWYYPNNDLPQGLVEYLTPAERERYNAQNAETGPTAHDENIVVVDGVILNLDEYISVKDFNSLVRREISRSESLCSVKVKGEVTNYDGEPNNGNYYFSIKDRECNTPCYIGSYNAGILNFTLAAGQQVAIVGKYGIYQKDGATKLYPTQIYNIGDGAINLEYLQLRERLREEGLFDAAHKKEVPNCAERIALITAAGGDAIVDFVQNLKERNPYVHLYHYKCNVQGANAVRSIIDGIRVADSKNLDLIIVGRGGGSTEERIAFNDEGIARAIYNCVTPIVTAIGHTRNLSLADEVADFYYKTPTEAGQKSTADIASMIKRLANVNKERKRIMLSNLNQRKQELQTASARLEQNSPKRKVSEKKMRVENTITLIKKNVNNVYLRDLNKLKVLEAQLESNNPRTRIKQQKLKLENLSTSLTQNIKAIYNRKKHSVDVAIERLHGLSPTAKLVNGFGYVQSQNGKPVTSVGDINAQDKIQITISDGDILATVDKVNKNNNV